MAGIDSSLLERAESFDREALRLPERIERPNPGAAFVNPNEALGEVGEVERGAYHRRADEARLLGGDWTREGAVVLLEIDQRAREGLRVGDRVAWEALRVLDPEVRPILEEFLFTPRDDVRMV